MVEALQPVFEELAMCGLDDRVLSKGGVGTILLAHQLGHEIAPGDKGPDASDSQGNSFEYKVSRTDNFNFNLGGRPRRQDPSEKIHKHFAGLAGAYCGLREGARFVRIAYCPSRTIMQDMVRYFAVSKADTLNRRYTIESFLALPGARGIPVE